MTTKERLALLYLFIAVCSELGKSGPFYIYSLDGRFTVDQGKEGQR